MLTTETYITALSAIASVRKDIQASLERESKKVFFRNDRELRACAVALARLDRASDELQAVRRQA